jgi:hypothetical protein
MTTGRATRIADHSKLGPWKDGSPIQSACPTAEKSSRQWSVSLPLPSTEWILPKIRSRAQDRMYPKTSPRKIAIRDQKPRRQTTARPVNSITSRAVHWSCGQ